MIQPNEFHQLPLRKAEVDELCTTLQVREAQLRQKHQLAKVGLLAGGICHEYNNLLQIIRAYASFAQEVQSSESPAFSDLAVVLEAADEAALLTRRLLDYSRTEEGQPLPWPIDEILLASVAQVAAQCPPSIRLNWRLLHQPVGVALDPELLRDALVELCINALEAMSTGGELALSVEHFALSEEEAKHQYELSPGSYVRIQVADTGRGIAPELQASVTKPFFSTKTPELGRGVGLSLATRLARQFGGQLSIHSEPDHGTTVKVLFPALRLTDIEVKSQQVASR